MAVSELVLKRRDEAMDNKIQFDPHYWSSADRNFQFYLNPTLRPMRTTSWSSYVLCEVLHPHGT